MCLQTQTKRHTIGLQRTNPRPIRTNQHAIRTNQGRSNGVWVSVDTNQGRSHGACVVVCAENHVGNGLP